MRLGQLMSQLPAPDPGYSGILTNDNFVLAVNVDGPESAASFDTYAVVQGAIEGVDAQLNPVMQDKQYLRAGQSTTKTGTQRSFKATGDRYIGDDFQDFVFEYEQLYGVGEAVVTDYVWFCLQNGKGEQGKVAVVVNSDGSGSAGETASVDIDLRKTGDMPTAYTYVGTGGGLSIGKLTVVSLPGTSGKTKIYVNPLPEGANTYKTQVAETVKLPSGGVAPGTGWTVWNGTTELTAVSGQKVGVVELDAQGKTVKGGVAIVNANDA